MHLQLSRRERRNLLLLGLATLLALYAGWRLFWFLTDDAYIAFRYVSNSMLGHGYVWNPPPFRPVEGYTSFLWILLLDGVWRLTGQPPPVTANMLALFLAAGTLLLGGLMILRLELPPQLRRNRVALLGVVLLGVLSNRTFLAWTSSGLETALFNFLLILWIWCALCLPLLSRRWLLGMSAAAVLLDLTRPDGLLFVAATLFLLLWAVLARRQPAGLGDEPSRAASLAAGAPLLLVPAHLLWRHGIYGAWLPNTYHAKAALHRIWPASGLRYLGSFVLEYALWVWLALAAWWAWRWLRTGDPRHADPEDARTARRRRLLAVVVVGILLAHLAYYTLVIGGDHFEYRVYSHLFLLLAVAAVWMLGRLRVHPRTALAVLMAWFLLSWPIPWAHWVRTHRLATREETRFLAMPVAPVLEARLPRPLRWAAAPWRGFDRWQGWLIDHAVCMRHQEHKIFHEFLVRHTPARGATPVDSLPGCVPVRAAKEVGYLSWVLPGVDIIDMLGLNDWVIARNPELHERHLMGHERQAPPGYLECFDPALATTPRIVQVPEERVRECERRFAASAGQ